MLQTCSPSLSGEAEITQTGDSHGMSETASAIPYCCDLEAPVFNCFHRTVPVSILTANATFRVLFVPVRVPVAGQGSAADIRHSSSVPPAIYMYLASGVSARHLTPVTRFYISSWRGNSSWHEETCTWLSCSILRKYSYIIQQQSQTAWNQIDCSVDHMDGLNAKSDRSFPKLALSL